MNHLAFLKPAETLVLQYQSKADFKELLKVTFMDLLLKQVLVVKDTLKEIKRGNRLKQVKSKYVITGKNFTKYSPSPFEEVFLSVFIDKPQLKANLKPLIKVAYEASDKYYAKAIVEGSSIKDLFKTVFYQKYFGKFSLTKKGKETMLLVKKELEEVDQKIGDLIQNKPNEALEILLKIGGNIFLLQNLEFELLRKIDSSIVNSIKTLNQGGHQESSYYWDFIDLYWLDTLFDSWEDTFNTFDSGYDDMNYSYGDFGGDDYDSWDYDF